MSRGMDAKTKALRNHRARLKRQGMRRLEVSVPAAEASVIRKAAAVLREQSGEAARLRQVLGFAREREGPANAVDLFAMPVALSPAGEALWNAAVEQIERDRKDLVPA
jgi:hypothetical protein